MQGIHVEQIGQSQAAVFVSFGLENRPTRVLEEYEVHFHRVSAENRHNWELSGLFVCFFLSMWRALLKLASGRL